MRKWMAVLAISLALAMPTVQAAGGVNGVVKLRPELNFTAMGSGSTRNGERGTTVGIGWAVNREKGARRDRVTRVQLISRDMDMTALTTGEIEDWYQNDIAPAEQPIFLTETQENGSYVIDDVPEGRYYLVIVAGQMDDGSADPLRTRSGEALSKYLPLWDQYAMFVIGMNSCVVQEIEITDGAMTRADYDFGEIIGK